MPHPLITIAEQLVEIMQEVEIGEPFSADWDFWRAHDEEQGELDQLVVMVFVKIRSGAKVGQEGWQHQGEISIAFQKKLPGNDDHQEKLAMQRAKRDAAAAVLAQTETILDAVKTSDLGDVLLREMKASGVSDVLPDAYTTGFFLRVVGLTFDEETALLP